MSRIQNIACVFIVLAGGIACADGRNLTFVVWSDSHFGAYDYADTTRLDIMEQINSLAAVTPPDGFVPLPEGTMPDFLMHCGDITERGTAVQWDDPNAPDQQSYLQTLTRLDRRIKPYAVPGNHDSRKTGNVRQQFAAMYHGTYYSFDCRGVHIVGLDPYPNFNSAAPSLDEAQLKWLRSDLNRTAADTPVVIVMHVQPDCDESLDRTSRLDRKSTEALADVIAGKNIVAFLHGHWHKTSLRSWRGIPVIEPAGFAYYRDGCKNGQPILGVVQITDTAMTVYSYNWHTRAYEKKPLYRKTFSPRP